MPWRWGWCPERNPFGSGANTTSKLVATQSARTVAPAQRSWPETGPAQLDVRAEGAQPLLTYADILAEHGESALLSRNHFEQRWFPCGDLFLSTLDRRNDIGWLFNPLAVSA